MKDFFDVCRLTVLFMYVSKICPKMSQNGMHLKDAFVAGFNETNDNFGTIVPTIRHGFSEGWNTRF